MKNLKQKILDVLIFYSLFDFALKKQEIFKYLSCKTTFQELDRALFELEKEQVIQKKSDFYFLPGEKNNIDTRLRRQKWTKRKIIKAKFISAFFYFIPWIKMIAIGNMIGEGNLKNNSDIDFFIITQKNRIWLSRMFTNAITTILRIRPSQNKMRDTICLSFFISEEYLNLENLMLKNKKDLYFIHWLAGLKLIFSKSNTWQKFIQANFWLKKYLPNFNFDKAKERKKRKMFFTGFSIFDKLESKAKKFQLKILPKEIKEKMNKNSNVIINDKILKMHLNDRRAYYYQRYVDKRLKKFLQS